MRQKKTIPFEITSIDSLGQGVSKLLDKVAFIPKTMVGDRGEAEVMAERKGVIFARAIRKEVSSERRIAPECVHFDSCSSCHYLHMPYKDELSYKKENLEKMFRNLPLSEVEVIEGEKRLHYRNRVQLHYSLKSKLLGLKDSKLHSILPVPNCLIAVPEVANEIKRLYQNNTWMTEAPLAPTEGHVEIYFANNELKVTWNRPYAEGGFTQVFQEMNEKLKTILRREWSSWEQLELLDLFAGNGNLSNQLNHSSRLCVDVYSTSPGPEFFSQDLYHKEALKKVKQEVVRRGIEVQQMLLDPPRSGLKNITEWVEEFTPHSIAYVSCDPHTLARDLQTLEGYSLKKTFLIDFFPSTFHFETLVFLERNHL